MPWRRQTQENPGPMGWVPTALLRCALTMLFLSFVTPIGASSYQVVLDDPLGDVATTAWPPSLLAALGSAPSAHVDLQQWAVAYDEGSSLVQFQVTWAALEDNAPTTPLGFRVPLVHLYLHPAPPGSWRVAIPDGAARQPLSNPNTLLSDQYYWEHMVEITGYGARLFGTDGLPEEANLSVTRVGTNTIQVQVPVQAIGTPHEDWSYTLLVGALFNLTAPSSVHPARFWPVEEETTDGTLGGGDAGSWDPNVLDLLTMPQAAWSQAHQLYTYCAATHQQATARPVGGHMPPYLRSERDSPTISREQGGAGCVSSTYQTTPHRRYTARPLSPMEWALEYVADPHDLDELGLDEPELRLIIDEWSNCTLRLQITTPHGEREALPFVRDAADPEGPGALCSERLYAWEVQEEPFGVQVTRLSTGEVLFHSLEAATRNLVFKERYLEISTALPPHADLYGLGEQVGSLRRARQGETVTLWNTDRGTPAGPNLYGSHPFYVDMRAQASHGVFLANSHGMDVVLTPQRATFKMTGGLIDLYLFLGPSVESVTRQYHALIGRPQLPPLWALGYHQCRWGYENVEAMQAVADAFHAYELPLDTMWSDIDYMEQYKLFTLDPVHFPASGMRPFVEGLHAQGRQYVMIIDPGVKIEEGYAPYDEGVEAGLFIQQPHEDAPTVGKVWPGLVAFVDWTHPQATAYWTRHFTRVYEQQMPFDGLWIDMNEIASFCDGHCVLDHDAGPSLFECHCTQPRYEEEDFPPYLPGGLPPDTSTISMAARHYNNTRESHWHNLYGFLEARATQAALETIRGGRTFVLSRSTFAGSGRYTAHWLGDNHATWEDMRYSIAGMIHMNLFGLPMVGADVCGFEGNTTAELCTRWMQLGAFSPFYRNHNARGLAPQEPYRFGEPFTSIARHALQVRYSLLSFLYSHLMEVSFHGGMLIDSLAFLAPQDAVARTLDTQFVVGKTLMVAPVLEPQALVHRVYFPPTVWYDFFTGEIIVRHDKVANATEGVWVTFDQVVPVPLRQMFVFLRSGAIVPVQEPALTSAETRAHPFDLVVALQPGHYASGRLLLDDGVTQNGPLSEWVFYTDQDAYVSQLVVNRTRGDWQPVSGVELRNVTIYGVEMAVNEVLLNGNKDLAFVWDAPMRTLVVLVHADLLAPNEPTFFIAWTHHEVQPLLERVFMLVGSLTLAVALLSFVSLLVYHYGGRSSPCCMPPAWLRIPTIPEVPSHVPTPLEGGTEMDRMDSGPDEDDALPSLDDDPVDIDFE